MKTPKIPLIVIVGPTAVGKSDLAVEIARKIGGEVISADSRQVYKGLDIGTGKITQNEMKGVPHHMLDVADPRIKANSPRRYSVETWRSAAEKIIHEIVARGHVPIVCGGTGFYIEALVDGKIYPDVPPNPRLRKSLSRKSPAALFKILQKMDPRRAREMKGGAHSASNGESQNPHRLIRAIEIATALGKVPQHITRRKSASSSPYAPIFIGLTLPPEQLKERIAARLKKRIAAGMIDEIRNLHKPISKGGAGVSWKRMEELGLEYRYVARYLVDAAKIKKMNISTAQKNVQLQNLKTGMTEKLAIEIWHYARRQMTWFRRDPRIRWFSPKKFARTF